MTAMENEDELLHLVALKNASSILIARRHAEQRNEAYLAEAQRLSRTGSFGWTVSSGAIHWSDETFRIFQYPPTTKPTTELVYERVHADDVAQVKRTMERASQDGKDFDHEYRLLMPDGSIKHVHVVAHASGQDAGELEFVGAVMDVSDQHQAKAELRRAIDAIKESEEQWRDVFENNPTMYFMVNGAGRIVAVNPLGAEQLGYRVEELVGEPLLSVFHEADREAVQGHVAICFGHLGQSRSWEARKVRKDRAVIWVRETAKAVSRTNGSILLVASEDVTEQKRAAEALRQAQADLAHVSRVTTMGELTASLAHEVNQPIAATVMNANACVRWLSSDPPNLDEARAAAKRIVQDGTRAGDIISRIRLIYKKGTPQREWIDANEIIREMIVLLRNEAARYAIPIRTELRADLPKVLGDRVQLQQVMMNLVVNGIDAMKDVNGTRELAITSRAEGEHILISVSDTGVGLPAQQAHHIFDAFFTTKAHGIGMGLSISRSILDSHGGRLWAAENVPRGARFSFTLPCAVDSPPRPSHRTPAA
jgi:PAS domain S-box-containing protein